MEKKINLFFFTLILTSLSVLYTNVSKVSAQEIGIGVKAGANFSTQLNNFQFTTGDLQINLDPSFTFGYHLGLIYRQRIARNFRMQAEPTFLNIGASYKDSFTFRGFDFQTDSKTRLSYIQLPLMLEWTTTPPDLKEVPVPWEITTYHASIGLYSSYLVDAIFSGNNSGSPIGVDFDEEFSNDVTDQLNYFDAGFIIGGGLEYGHKDKMGIEARVMLGMFNSGNIRVNEFKPDNLSISIAAYYMF